MLKHNKKRNAGLLSEFFARYMAKAIIEKRDGDLEKAKDLFARHFRQGTDLYGELRMFQALLETNLDSRDAAVSLLEQVKRGCKLQSQARLDLEKSALLHEINVHLGGPAFFQEEVGDYRNYATIQVFLNHWRGGLLTEHLGEVAQLEDKILATLTSKEQKGPKSQILNLTNQDVDGLVVNLMTKKLNEKYRGTLNEEQKEMLQLYVFSKDDEKVKDKLIVCLESLRQKALENITQALSSDSDAKVVASKLQEVKTLLQEDFGDTKRIDDQLVTFYLGISTLRKELINE